MGKIGYLWALNRLFSPKTMAAKRSSGVKKTFVLDTNVMLHDHQCLEHFQENDIVIPIVALEELDKFKKGNDTINYNAREFARALDAIAGDQLFTNGVSLGPGRGMLRIVTGKPFSDEMRLSFGDKCQDHRILAIADWVRHQVKDEPVILVSKDINLRMKAKSLGIMAQDYLTDKVETTQAVDAGAVVLENIKAEVLDALYRDGVDPQSLGLTPKAYDCYELHTHSGTGLAIYDPMVGRLRSVDKRKAYGIEPRNSEQTFALHILLDEQIPLVALSGKAGTGKTILALAAALALEEDYDKILLARPIIPLSNKDIGFLPGDVNSKIGPYMQPLFDNLSVIKNALKSTSRSFLRIEEMQRSGKLEISPLAYIRGRSLSGTFVIVDEAQNLTPHEVKTIITRAGEGTRLIFCGDIFQIDHPYLDARSNGLSYMTERMSGQTVFAHMNLVKGERSRLAELASNLL